MQISRQNEWHGINPLANRGCFGLFLLAVRLEIIGEIAVQVETSDIISEETDFEMSDGMA